MFHPAKQQKKMNISPLKNTKVLVETEPRNQAEILQLFRIEETGNIKDKAAIALLNEILGGNSNSRLFNDLREKQKLAYRVASRYTSSNNEGLLQLGIFTTTDNSNNPQQSENLQKSLNGFSQHIQKLINQNVSQEELEAAKLQIKSALEFNFEPIEGKNSILTSSMNTIYRENYLKEFLKALENTTVEDIRKIAQYYLTKPSVISIIASEKTIKENENYLNSLGELQKF